jgi:membrane protease YdiL (CAAX protease family)
MFFALTMMISWGSLGTLFPIGPALAATILTWRESGRGGLGALGARLLPRTMGREWFGFVAVAPIALSLAVTTTWLAVAHGHLHIDIRLLALSPLLLVAFAAVAVFEELGWRGYLQPALDEELPPLPAAILVGVAWGLWHVPLVLFGGGVNADLPLFAYPAVTIPASIVYAWLFHKTNGSVLAPTLLHGAQQAVILPVVFGLHSAHSSIASYFYVLTLVAWSIGIALAVRRPQLGKPRTKRREQAAIAD